MKNESKQNGKVRRARLNKKLAAYSAMATGVVAAATGTSAQAVPIVHDIPDLTTTAGTLDGIVFNIVTGSIVGTSFIDFDSLAPQEMEVANNSSGGMWIYPGYPFFGASNNVVGYVNVYPLVSKLSSSVSVGPGANFISAAQFGYFEDSVGAGQWNPGDRGFAGVRFDLSGATHHGWVEVSTNADNSVTLHAFGFESDPDTPIHINPAIPEPATFGLAMLALGAVGVSALKRRRAAETT